VFEDDKDDCCNKESTTRNDKEIVEDVFEDDKDDCRNEESTTRNDKAIVEDVFEDNKDDCCNEESTARNDKAIVEDVCSKTTKMTVATKNPPQKTSSKMTMMSLSNFFFSLAGNSLTKTTVLWQKTTVVTNSNPSQGMTSLSLKMSSKVTKTTLLNFFFALAGSRLTNMTVVWQKTNTDEESIARHHTPIAKDEFQPDREDCMLPSAAASLAMGEPL
jgi:hypothetical protein